MNILPFVTIFILVIALTISSFFQGFKETSFSKIGSVGVIKAYRLARNSSEETRLLNFAKATPKVTDPEAPKNTPSRPKVKKTTNRSFRENITDNSKFNLTPLLKEDNLFLEGAFANLLRELYLNTAVINDYKYEKEALPKLLAKQILQTIKALPQDKPIEFEKIVLPNKDLHAIWYKMLKGTPNYPEKGGWPPFSQFFILKETKEKAVISAKKAAIPVLKAFFGEEITKEILLKEKEEDRKYQALSKEEITALISDHNFPLERRPYIHYGYGKIVRRTETEKDPTSGIPATVFYTTTKPD